MSISIRFILRKKSVIWLSSSPRKCNSILQFCSEEFWNKKKVVNVIDKDIFSNKIDPIHQCFHVQLLSQDVKKQEKKPLCHHLIKRKFLTQCLSIRFLV